MPYNTDHWDSMREWEDRMKKLKEDALEEGIEVSDASINNAMSLFSALTPAQGGENPSRLLKHKDDSDAYAYADDEWRIPTQEG